MPVLKDLECSRCGSVTEALVDGDVTIEAVRCECCRKLTVHRTICNGGVRGARWRYADCTSDYIRDRFHVRKVEAYTHDADGNEVPVTHYQTGKDILDTSGLNNEEGRQERKNRIHHAFERRRGRGKLQFDQKRRPRDRQLAARE